jgi:predicted hotdog family 3-hydroxylacyl-ACP dehydratase
MDILDLIPQRSPIVMVDSFLGIEEGVSHTSFRVAENNILVKDNCFTECGLIEHIAQSAAARVGYIFRSQDKEVPIGYIGSVNKLSVNRLAKVGDQIMTSVSVIQEVMGVSLIEASCKVKDEVIATGRMKIFLDLNNGA